MDQLGPVGTAMIERLDIAADQQHLDMISEHVSLAVAALQQVGEPARERLAKAVIARASTYEEDGKVRIPDMARCIVGTKQGYPDCACAQLGLFLKGQWRRSTAPRRPLFRRR